VNRADLIQELRNRGIDRVYGRALSRCLKHELEAYYRRLSEGDTIQHISFSQINMYLRCGMQYWFRYVEGIKLPPPGAVALGKSVHRAIEYNYQNKIMSGRDEALSTLQDLFVDTFREEAPNALWDEEKPENAEKDGLGLVKTFRQEVAPETFPRAVEKEFNLTFQNVDYKLKGVIDVIDWSGIIIDHKTTKKSYTQDQVETDLQLTLYALAQGTEDVGFDVLVRTKTPKAQRLRSKRDDHTKQRALAIIAYVMDGIYKNTFLPARPSDWWCSPRWCGYWDLCQKELI